MHLLASVVTAAGVVAALAAGIRGLPIIWRFCRKLARVTDQAADALPVLMSIGEQFKNNGGTTLKDTIDGHTRTLREHTQILDDQCRQMVRMETKLEDIRETRRTK